MFAISGEEFRSRSAEDLANIPPFRRLRGYAFDPSLSLRLETAPINHTVFEVPWESGLLPGPRGEYVEVVDYDPASAAWYEPVDLNSVNLLAQDGLPPSEGHPQFHQQMVYAVAMNTISNFEKALGRQVLWSPRVNDQGPTGKRETFVRTLRIYPHALRAANAYYSPVKKALMFGYFQGPTGTVFSCLSQDIIAHETTHALLDGMHRRYVEDNHPDTLAFHEAFADLVALFQHFTFPDVLKHQIAQTRGDLETQSLLGELAQEFGQATGRYGALRNAIGEWDEGGKWSMIKPDPARLATAKEPHERGSILVAAMFAAFLAIYKARTKGIIGLASSGSGILPEGALHPTLIDALAQEATKTAKHFLGMCIRALDYCPPFDITYGDYLRALVTADYDMVPNDKHGYRIALIESFRRWGITPDGLRTLKAGIVQDPAALQALVLKGIDGLIEATPTATSSHKDWSEFAKRYGEILARTHGLPGTEGSEHLPVIRDRIKVLQAQADEHLQAWVAAKHYADLILQPVTKGPVMVHHVPRFLRHRRSAGETKVALLVFDGLAFDQWVQIRERLISTTKRFAFDEGTAFAWLPTVTSVSRQALFSGLKPREFDDSIERTDKEESLWKTFWQNEGVNPNEVMYRRALRQTSQLDALEADLINRSPKVVGLVIDEVDDRLHKERSKKDVAMWIGNWLTTGFVDRLFSLLLDKGYNIYLTADHGNVESTGVGRPNQGVIAETRGERVRVYRSEPLLADSAAAYPNTVRLDIAGLPANFMPLFAGGRTAFVPEGEQVVVHGGVSIEELIVPFVKVSYVIGTE